MAERLNSAGPLLEASQGYQTLNPGLPPSRFLPLDGMLPNTPGWQLAGMVATPFATSMMANAQMTPFGVGHDQNIYDIANRKRFEQLKQDATAKARRADEMSYMRVAQGIATLSGTPLDEQTKLASVDFSKTLSAASPLLATMAPELLDQLHGSRGSGVLMADRMINAGRYRIDPTTGLPGGNPEYMADVSNQLYEKMYAGKNYKDMKGITAGQLGDMFGELQSRGMIGTLDSRKALASMDQDKLRQAAFDTNVQLPKKAGGDIDTSKMSDRDIDKLMASTDVSTHVKQVDTKRIEETLKKYVGATAAMREIFGDAGHPNASMPQLIQGLEALTMGQAGQMDPAKLSSAVRNTYYMAKDSGMDMSALMALSQDAASRAKQFGLEGQFGMSARDHAISFAQARKSIATTPSFGGMTADQMTQLDSSLHIQASASQNANTLASAITLGALAGEDTDLAKAAEAIKKGQGTYTDSKGEKKSVFDLDQAKLTSLARESGVSDATSLSVLRNNNGNRETIAKYDLGTLIREKGMVEEVGKYREDSYQSTLRSQLGQGKAEQATDMGSSIAAKMAGLSVEESASPEKRREKLEQFLKESGVEATPGKIKEMALALDADFDTTIAGNPRLSQFETQSNLYSLMDKETMDRGRRFKTSTDLDNRIREVTAGAGNRSLLSGAMDAIRDVDPDNEDSVLDGIAGVLGGIKDSDLTKMHKPIMEALNIRKELSAARDDVVAGKEGAKEAFDEKVKMFDAAMGRAEGLLPEYMQVGKDQLKGERVSKAHEAYTKEKTRLLEESTKPGAERLSNEEVERRAQAKFNTEFTRPSTDTFVEDSWERTQYTKEDVDPYDPERASFRVAPGERRGRRGAKEALQPKRQFPTDLEQQGPSSSGLSQATPTPQIEQKQVADKPLVVDIKGTLSGDFKLTPDGGFSGPLSLANNGSTVTSSA